MPTASDQPAPAGRNVCSPGIRRVGAGRAPQRIYNRGTPEVGAQGRDR